MFETHKITATGPETVLRAGAVGTKAGMELQYQTP